MVGWQLSCPVCGASLKDARPLDVLARVDAAEPFLGGVAGHARKGEETMMRAAQIGPAPDGSNGETLTYKCSGSGNCVRGSTPGQVVT